MIGIGITVYNRLDVFGRTLSQIQQYAPEGAKIVVVDDGSTRPVPGATYRFKKNAGTPTAKNKCLELLDDCEHIFLFDDDCYPVVHDWWKPYVESPELHLNFTFKYNKEVVNGHAVCENPNGCMMYFHNKVLDVVGGFDTGFKMYGYWHGAMSLRVYNAGLTSHPFMDVAGSEKLFVSMDKQKTVRTSRPDRGKYLAANKKRYDEKLGSKEYISYKSALKIWYSNPYSAEKNIGKALNEFCELVPENDWICLQDGDMLYLTPDWGKQIEDVIRKHGDNYSLFGCVTNRLGRKAQRHEGTFSNNHDIKHHFEIAQKLRDEHWAEVEDITRQRYVAGLFMLFPKKLWLKHKFKE